MGFKLDPDDASKYPLEQVYGIDVEYDNYIVNELYKADSITDLLYSIALIPGIDKCLSISIIKDTTRW